MFGFHTCLYSQDHLNMDQQMLLRVVISDDDIRKLMLSKRPDSIEDLKDQLKNQLSLQYDFKLQYEDEDFNNALCNLTEIGHLPEKATLKILLLITLNLRSLSSPNTSSDTECSTADTEILSACGTSHSLRQQWPDFFNIPNFSVDVEYRLRQGDLAFMKDGTRMTVSRDMKHDILEKIAESMYTFKAYPDDDDDFTSVAKALISKHPCLTEPGLQPGWYGWKNSLKFKMANYCTKLRKVGFEDVTVNGGKRSKANPVGEYSSKNVKRPKRGEANYLPNFPDGHDEITLENARKVMADEIKKKLPDATLISQLMDLTFPLRRQEIVKEAPAVQNMAERWPGLFKERQIFAEFFRITSKNLEGDFIETLDQLTPRFIEIFESKKGTTGQKLTELLQDITGFTQDVTALHSVVLKGIPIILGDDATKCYKTCFVTMCTQQCFCLHFKDHIHY
ncbi:uncharacterized protein LOC102082521 [Oreochromis niloticus]|uniref:uncharacterized protein LOC102082521 n=1 Tax=Oreochromis niloticus TaxID=8128 RepID=UPI000905BA9A|nr:uncharacterized protein LOC102082521 [Oreochromis niloticus]